MTRVFSFLLIQLFCQASPSELWLHFGPKKTGSSTLQASLDRNNGTLKNLNISFPCSSHCLALYCDFGGYEDPICAINSTLGRRMMNDRLRTEARTFLEILGHSSLAHPNLLLSKEHNELIENNLRDFSAFWSSYAYPRDVVRIVLVYREFSRRKISVFWQQLKDLNPSWKVFDFQTITDQIDGFVPDFYAKTFESLWKTFEKFNRREFSLMSLKGATEQGLVKTMLCDAFEYTPSCNTTFLAEPIANGREFSMVIMQAEVEYRVLLYSMTRNISLFRDPWFNIKRWKTQWQRDQLPPVRTLTVSLRGLVPKSERALETLARVKNLRSDRRAERVKLVSFSKSDFEEGPETIDMLVPGKSFLRKLHAAVLAQIH